MKSQDELLAEAELEEEAARIHAGEQVVAMCEQLKRVALARQRRAAAAAALRAAGKTPPPEDD